MSATRGAIGAASRSSRGASATATARRTTVAALVTGPAVAAALMAPTAAATDVADPGATAGDVPVSVIAREVPGAGQGPERVLDAVGGTKGRILDIVDGYTATLPAEALPQLSEAPGVLSVTPDSSVQLSSADEEYAAHPTSMAAVADAVGARAMWKAGATGEGVDVALIDSGVVPVDGLRTPGKVVHGPDLSFEASDCSDGTCVPSPARHLDSYDHGTHMAGIIAGRDDAAPAAVHNADRRHFLGVAPDARIVSVKVADSSGAADVSQVIAGIEWVVEHRRSGDLDIRVLNLSFGTDGVQDYLLDPLAHAAETAWHQGIVVVVAAGNSGDERSQLTNPAHDPYLLAVGATDGRGTAGIADDTVPSWSNAGDEVRNVDLVAPGSSVVSLRSPGSLIDTAHPNARTDDRFFRGSGTSQAAAVVSGAAALVVQERPEISPDQVKALLRQTARRLPAAEAAAQGEGLVDLVRARADLRRPRMTTTPQQWTQSDGSGSLEAARGSHHVAFDGEPLVGEVDVTGRPWNGGSWNGGSWNGGSWNGGSWNGGSWNGGSWNTVAWGAPPPTGP